MSSKRGRVDRAADKASVAARAKRAEHVGTVGPQSPIWQAQQTMKDLGGQLVAAGTTLTADDAAVVNADAAAAAARTKRDADIVVYDAVYNAYVAGAEHFAASPADLQALGMSLALQDAYGLANPLGVVSTFDPQARLVRIHVTCAPGMRHCRIEIASDQAMTQNLALLPGDGARQSVANLAAGTWWVRAAHVRAAEMSGFTGPASVIVK